MAKSVKISVIGAGSAQFSLGLVKDLCLTEGLKGTHISFMDIHEGRLDMIYKLGTRYAQEMGADLTFDKTLDREASLKDADFVINTAYVLGHEHEAEMRDLATRNGYYHQSVGIPQYYQYALMLSVAKDMERICPDAWLIQVGNPVFSGSTLMTRETGIKVCGLCHGHYGYREVAETIGLDPDQVVWQAPGLNHNIWMTHFMHQGKDAYPLVDEWIETQGEEYWRTHQARSTHDAQMSRGACHQYKLYGLMPIGDTVRRGGWWYHTNIETKKHWFGEPYGGPDTHVARPYFVKNLEQRIAEYTRIANDPQASVSEYAGKTMTREQIVPIVDGLMNNHEGYFQVNVPNHGALPGIPDDVVVEVPAIVNIKGIQPVRVDPLPQKIMLGHVLPEWLEMERDLYTFKTGDRALMLYDLLQNHQTCSYAQAVDVLNETLKMEFHQDYNEYFGENIDELFQWPKGWKEVE
jgi:alpha-galactosidase